MIYPTSLTLFSLAFSYLPLSFLPALSSSFAFPTSRRLRRLPTPTILSHAMGAFSDDEDLSKDSRSLTSRDSSNNKKEGQYSAYSQSTMCGAIFVTPYTGEKEYVCFRPHGCRRPGHKEHDQCQEDGLLFKMIKSKKNKYYDGILNTGITVEVFQANQERELNTSRMALRSYATSHSTETPSSHSSRPSNAWQHKATLDPVRTPRNLKNPPQQATPAPEPKGPVHFLSPVETFSHIRTTTATPSGTPEDFSEAQWAAALKLARQMAQAEAAEGDGPTETSRPDAPRKSKGAKDRKSRKSTTRTSKSKSKKRHSRKKKGSHSSSSSSESGLNSDSDQESDPSSSSESSQSVAPTYWYAVIFGIGGRYLVTPIKQEAKALLTTGSRYRRFTTQDEAWAYVDQYRNDPPRADTALRRVRRESPLGGSLPETPPQVTPVSVRSQGPGVPPLMLNGRDKSAKTEDEIFGISLDTDVGALHGKLAPPGVTSIVAQDLTECLVDAVSLPGKTGQSTESEDTVANLQISIEALGHSQRQNQSGEQQRRDLKWSQLSRNVLKTVKTVEDLRTMMIEVMSLKESQLSSVISWQKTILAKEPWEAIICETWSQGGYITVLSRKSLEHYISLLEHLLGLGGRYPWDIVQQEIDFYVQKWVLIRNNSQNRVMALCRIYVTLRDGASRDWITPKLEAKKLIKLYQDLHTALGQLGGDSGTTNSRGQVSVGFCIHCGTILHGSTGCPWGSLSAGKAKEKGKAALKALGGGARPLPAAGAANQEG